MELPKTQIELIFLLEIAYGLGYNRGYEASPYEPDEYKNPSFDDFIEINFNEKDTIEFWRSKI